MADPYTTLGIPTTAASIRDRIISVIGGLTPSALVKDRFKKFRNEGSGDFRTWAQSRPESAWRRFQVRDTGADSPPAISNTDVEERTITFEIIVAYGQTNRAGKDAALDRDDLIALDRHQIEHAIGMTGRANFSAAVNASYPDACWRSGSTAMESAAGVDFIVITQTMTFRRLMTNPVTANFTTSLTVLAATFTDTSTDLVGAITTWAWNFGDGGSSSLQNPSHTYATAGTYTVTLTVTDNLGSQGTKSSDISPALPAVTTDGPSAIKVPSLAAQWPTINAAFPSPSWHWPMQEASGDLVDVLNAQHMVQTGAGTYANAIAGWATKFLGTTEVNAQCWTGALGSAWNTFTQSVFVYGLVRFASSSGVRRWFVVNGTTFYLEILTNGRMRLNGGTSGLLDHRSTLVRPFVVEMIGGAGMTGHAGAGLFRLSTDIEQVTGTWSSQPDSTKGAGSVSAAGAAPMVGNFAELTAWAGNDAEALSTFGPKAFLQALNWTVTGY